MYVHTCAYHTLANDAMLLLAAEASAIVAHRGADDARAKILGIASAVSLRDSNVFLGSAIPRSKVVNACKKYGNLDLNPADVVML